MAQDHPRRPPEREVGRAGRPEPPPGLPEAVPRLPGEVYRDLRSTARGPDLDDLARAFQASGEALADGDTATAVELLAWARSVAPRSAVLREGLGVARYRHGDLPGAQRELLAYRRMTGRADQNHLLADCARAAGQHDRVPELVKEMWDEPMHRERIVEGLIVLASSRVERGELRGGLAVLRQDGLPSEIDDPQPWDLRLWYLAGDLCERAGDTEGAKDYFGAIVEVEEFLDARERLERLSG